MSEGFINKQPPKGLLRLLARFPILLYRAHLGWLLGKRFLMLTHTGRKSGEPRKVVLEVVSRDPSTETWVVASGWGEKSNWFQNILKTPEVVVQTGNRKFQAVAERLSVAEATRILCDYARRHPSAFRKIGKLMLGRQMDATEEDCRRVAELIPLVALRARP